MNIKIYFYTAIIFNFLILILFCSSVFANSTLTKIELHGAAKCMDGSAPAFYYDASVSSEQWLVILDDRNLCRDADGNEAENPEQCLSWCKTDESDDIGSFDADPLGICDSNQASSNNWQDNITKGSLFSSDAEKNPTFYDAHKVYIPSCSGDAWMGNASATVSDINFGTLYFHGKRIIDEVFDYLLNTGVNCISSHCNKISDDSKVLFGGFSRGAHGAWANIDRICDTVKLTGAECLGISSSLLPGYLKPPMRYDNTGMIVSNSSWSQHIARSKSRFTFQGIPLTEECKSIYTDDTSPITPINDFQLDPSDLSQDLCYTQLALVQLLDTPSFITINRYDGIEEARWFEGCEQGTPFCINNTVLRQWDLDDVALQFPSSFSLYLTTSSQHLYMMNKDGDCLDSQNGCWNDKNQMEEMNLNTRLTLSKQEALNNFIIGSTGKYWDTKRINY